MDFGSLILTFLILVLFFSLINYCCRRKREGTVFSTPVVVTSATHTAVLADTQGYQQTAYPPQSMTYPAQVMPYPPQATPYPPQATPYPPQTTPYPTAGAQGMPMPQPTQQPMGMPLPPNASAYAPGFQPHMAPYPPVAGGNPSSNPPSYDQAVAPGDPSYTKQAPYNPSYAGQ